MAADPKPTEETLVSEDKVLGGTVRVYYEIDEQERLVGEPRIVFALLHAQRNALGLGIETNDLHLDGLTDL